VIAVNFTEKLILIGGTAYAGEMKKSVFGILNYLLPGKGVMPMHCSANIGPNGDDRGVLRPFGHRQDHAVGRCQPHADRR
jgi:ATP-dependent phosphoenolpyruvate carboxykinase